MSFAITTLLILSSFDVYYFLLKFHAQIVSPLKYILCIMMTMVYEAAWILCETHALKVNPVAKQDFLGVGGSDNE
jgi:hypothetical protein